jgi:hypothetical protein
VSAAASIRRALALLQAASSDWRQKGPSDGSSPLYWPVAIAAAKAQLAHALTALEAQQPPSSVLGADAYEGMAWWNALPERERREWMRRAGDTGVAADAWEAYKHAGKEVATQTAD